MTCTGTPSVSAAAFASATAPSWAGEKRITAPCTAKPCSCKMRTVTLESTPPLMPTSTLSCCSYVLKPSMGDPPFPVVCLSVFRRQPLALVYRRMARRQMIRWMANTKTGAASPHRVIAGESAPITNRVGKLVIKKTGSRKMPSRCTHLG